MRCFPKCGWSVGVAAVGMLAASIAQAGSATSTFTASAVISPSCTVAATNLSFGTYAATTGTALAGTSIVNVYCTAGTLYTVLLNIGSGGGTFANRTMANGINLMNFMLYTSALKTVIWGDGTGTTGTVTGTGLGVLAASANTVYGSIPAGQDLPAGTYSSIITVTVNY